MNEEKEPLVKYQEKEVENYQSASFSQINMEKSASLSKVNNNHNHNKHKTNKAFLSDTHLIVNNKNKNSNKHTRQSSLEEFTPECIAFDATRRGKLFLRKEKISRKWKSVRDSIQSPGFLQQLRDAKDEEARQQLSEVIEEEGVEEPDMEDWVNYIKDDMIMGKWLNILFIFIPLAIASHYLQWGSIYIFWLNFLAMLPLASILGDFTEELALHTNEVIGGLVNATFGNAVELVVGIQALLIGEIRIVQSSMLGSVFSNLLLVLGCCYFFGGLRFKEQRFNAVSTTANMSLLALSLIGFVLPTPFAEWYEFDDALSLKVSRLSALCLTSMYFQLLLFQLKTHSHLMDGDGSDGEKPAIPFLVALVGLLLVTLMVTVLSDYLVGSIDEFVNETGISKTFVGMVILPIVGNAVEHITAVQVAVKDKMDMAMAGTSLFITRISLTLL